MVGIMVDTWRGTISAETANVTAYLSTYFGKPNVPHAAAAQLEEERRFDRAEAQAIVSYRQQMATSRVWTSSERTGC